MSTVRSGVQDGVVSDDGPIPFDRFVERALYGPEGFYTRGGSAGRRGDFITSPEVGPLFGAVLARYLDTTWDRLGRPDPFTVVEVGAGPGTLARSIAAASPRCAGAMHYVAVERSDVQRERHPDGIESTAAMPCGPLDGVVLANELLDNLPFRLAVFDGGWREAFVESSSTRGPSTDPAGRRPGGAQDAAGDVRDAGDAWDVGDVRDVGDRERLGDRRHVGDAWDVGDARDVGDDTSSPQLVERLSGRFDPVPAVLPERAPHGARAPLVDAAARWVDEARSLLRAGSVLVVDYGTPTTAELALRPWREWLRTYRGNERGSHPLRDVGAQDITTDVPFDQLPEPDAVRSQAQFLQLHGIDDLVEEGRRVWAERAAAPDLEAMRMRSRVSESEALLDPAGLGGFVVAEWRVEPTG